MLILEDDVEFDATAGTIMESLATALARQPWDICYLGFTDPKTPFECVADLDAEPVAVQIAGSEPAQMAIAARACVERGAQIIDINMG